MQNRNRYANVACGGLDVHYGFSQVTMRNGAGQVELRERLEHRDRGALRRRLALWPRGMPVVLEGSFGWGWLSDELVAAGLEVHLSNCYKLEQMRKARGGQSRRQRMEQFFGGTRSGTGQRYRPMVPAVQA